MVWVLTISGLENCIKRKQIPQFNSLLVVELWKQDLLFDVGLFYGDIHLICDIQKFFDYFSIRKNRSRF
ncbi:hypothetical protein D5C12_18820 [Salmonella enterica subsp. enterica]|nr:hypothetical protein [Salmonella enterica subsp. enterica]ECG1606949.1 hypothetical protein [Salmonella enterica subsp. enterica]ECR5889512.1 hypothetical protein [Salmonella enterica subsp. enterica]